MVCNWVEQIWTLAVKSLFTLLIEVIQRKWSTKCHKNVTFVFAELFQLFSSYHVLTDSQNKYFMWNVNLVGRFWHITAHVREWSFVAVTGRYAQEDANVAKTDKLETLTKLNLTNWSSASVRTDRLQLCTVVYKYHIKSVFDVRCIKGTWGHHSRARGRLKETVQTSVRNKTRFFKEFCSSSQQWWRAATTESVCCAGGQWTCTAAKRFV